MPSATGVTDVAVIGAGGATGRAVVAALVRRGAKVRALLHRDAQKALFPDLEDFALVELDDPSSLAEGLRGVASAYYIPPTYNAGEEAFGANVITAASAAGLPRLVYHSVLHAPTPAMVHHVRKSRVELALRESSLAWTILQPAMYVQTPYAFLSPARDALTPGFDVRKPFTPVDLQDLAEAAAVVLCEEGHAFATYELAGRETLSFEDMAQALSQALGQPVAARALAPELLLAQAAQRGFSASAVEELRLMMAHYDHHGLLGNGNVLRMLLGREPTTFARAVERDFSPSK